MTKRKENARPFLIHGMSKAAQFEHDLYRKYNITVEYYSNLRHKIQDNTCAICFCLLTDPSGQKDNKRTNACVDHCHRTGIVRGILCGNCNHMLGKAQDSVTILHCGIYYLKNSIT